MSPSRRHFLRCLGVAGAGSGLFGTLGIGPLRGPPVASALPGPLRRRGPGEAVLVLAGDLFLTEPFPPSLRSDTLDIYRVVREADASFANLENGLSTAGREELGGFAYGDALRGPPELAAELERIGLSGVSLANNHTGNFGPEALLQTARAVRGRGIATAGAGRDREAAFGATKVRAGRLTVGFVSVYSYYSGYEATDVAGVDRPGLAACRAREVVLDVPSGYRSEGRESSPYLLAPRVPRTTTVMAAEREGLEHLRDSVRRAARATDVVVVSVHFHWGRHTRRDVPEQQRAFAAAAVEAGADLVVGHGPHILRGMELMEKALVAYSLSNFVLRPEEAADLDLDDPPSGRRSALLRVGVSGRGPAWVEVLPFVIDAEGQPRAPDPAVADRILTETAAMSGTLGTELRIEGGVGRLEVPASA